MKMHHFSSGFSLEFLNKINYKGDFGGENHLRSPDLSLADNFEVTVWELADLKSFLVFSYAEIYFESFISEVLSKIEEHRFFWRQTCREPCILQVPTLLPRRSSYSRPPLNFVLILPLLFWSKKVKVKSIQKIGGGVPTINYVTPFIIPKHKNSTI